MGTVRSSDLQIVVISSLQIVSSTVFPVPSQFAAAKLTHHSTMPHQPSDSSRPRQRLLLSGDVAPEILALLPCIHVPCVQATSQVVGWAICAIVVLVGFIRSVLVFKTQRSTVELRTGLAVPYPLHKYRNRFHHQLQLKPPIGIPSPFCNSTQMASATNRLN